MTERHCRTLPGAIAAVGLLLAAPLASPPALLGQESSLARLARDFATPPDEARIMMRWWWFGPAVTQAGLDREMRAMKAGGMGGFEIQPVYPVALDDAGSGVVTHSFLSDAFLADLRYAADRARELGLRLDLTLGSGWPFGGPQVGIAQAAGRLRVERVPIPAGAAHVTLPDIRSGERLLAVFVGDAAPLVNLAGLREVADVSDGIVRLPDRRPAPREAIVFISGRTGMMVKRAAVGAEGFVVNHLDRTAVDHYLHEVGDRLLSPFGPNRPYAIFCDSLEVYESDWTDDFLDVFRARRGYDLRPLLPALVLDGGAASAAVRHDWGQTLTELVAERFLSPVQDWARMHGTRFRVQSYGIPPATISSSAGVDLPEGEGAQWKVLQASRWAASIGHLYGRPVISSETWTWLHSPVFMASPLDMKAEADVHFLQGINQLVGHGWPYSPDGAAYPGWRFYAAGVFNDKNPWWIVMPDVSRYLQRVSFLLRQGLPANDVAFYLPTDDTWSLFVPGKAGSFIEAMSQTLGPAVVAAIVEAGFNLDFVDDTVLATAHIESGRLAIGQNRYRAIVLPAIERMSPTTMRAVESFARDGVQVLATRRVPSIAPGYLATPADHAQVEAAAQRLFRGASAPGLIVDRDADLGAALRARLQPDVAVTDGKSAIGFVHRQTDAGEVYFVVNTSNAPVATDATFRVAAGAAQQWDPISGAVTPAAVRRQGAGATVSLDLPPYASTVIVFPSGGAGRGGPAAVKPQSAPPPPAIDISRDWRVTLGNGGTPADWPSLRSWTDDEATRHFSGVGVYERMVDVPQKLLVPGRSVWLDLGPTNPIDVGGARARLRAWLEPPVREAALVLVNGKRAGTVWCPPYAVEVTRWLRPGANTIRIEVGNLAINAMAGRALPDYKLLNLRYGTRFEPQDMDKVQPVPAGLSGPIRLVWR